MTDEQVENGDWDEAELEVAIPGPDDPAARSELACPECGEHRLSVLDFPAVPALGYQANSELLGMGELHAATPPAIGCLACGAEWPDLAAFRDAAESGR